ncbi:carboxypeptidase regulatory-like domain-containing protein [Micromonosporaceae bacterium Da 78-11]
MRRNPLARLGLAVAAGLLAAGALAVPASAAGHIIGVSTAVDDPQPPTGTLGGHLQNADGTPLAQNQVNLWLGAEYVTSTWTDDSGDYSFDAVLPGGYQLSFTTADGTDQWVPGSRQRSGAQTYQVVADQHLDVDDTLLAVSVMHGRLTGPKGAAKAGFHVVVTLDSEDDYAYFETTTDATGAWSVTGLYAGDYQVSFTSPDGKRTQWAYGQSREDTAAEIPVGDGASVTVDETWLPDAKLTVKAVDAGTGAAVSDFCVQINTPNDASGCTTGSSVTVGALPGGSFEMALAPDETSYYLRHADQTVTLTPGRTTTVTVPVTLGGKVAITATDRATGGPVARTCSVFLVLGRGGLPDGNDDCTEATGKATTRAMARGTYELFAYAPSPYGHQWVGASGGTGDQRVAARIVVQPGRTVAAPAVLLDRAGTVTGVVSGADGKPIKDADVAFSAWGYGSGPVNNTSTDKNGKYKITNRLGPYAWPLVFTADGYPRQWSGNKGSRFQAATVAVTSGATSTYDVTLARGAALQGAVTVAGTPQADWRITAHNAATGDQMGMFDSSAAGPGGAYTMPLTGSQQIKIDWTSYDGTTDRRGWYDHATDIGTATKVGVPAAGARTLNLTIG